MRSKQQLENSIQSAIKKELKRRGYLVRRSVMNSESGWLDLDVYKNGRYVAAEVKVEGEDYSEKQQYRVKQLEEQGIICVLVRSVNDCDRIEAAFKNYDKKASPVNVQAAM